jgi:hypothetical protein
MQAPVLKNFDISEIKNKPMRNLLLWVCIIIGLTLTVLCIRIIYRTTTGQYVNVFGWEPFGKDRTDTFFIPKITTIVVHDTIYSKKSEKFNNTSVKSFNQKGGQTARDIINK